MHAIKCVQQLYLFLPTLFDLVREMVSPLSLESP